MVSRHINAGGSIVLVCKKLITVRKVVCKLILQSYQRILKQCWRELIKKKPYVQKYKSILILWLGSSFKCGFNVLGFCVANATFSFTIMDARVYCCPPKRNTEPNNLSPIQEIKKQDQWSDTSPNTRLNFKVE